MYLGGEMDNKYIYHFTKKENLENIFKSDTLRIISIDNMNDINENTIQYPKAMTNVNLDIVNYLIAEYKKVNVNSNYPYKAHCQAKEIAKEVYKSMYSLSFVELREGKDKICECDLLWAHYGEKSKGVAIKFNKEKLNKLLEEQFYLKSAKQNINYVTKENFKIAIIEAFEQLIRFKKGEISIEDFLKKSNYFYKLKCWEYEKEYRFLVYSSEALEENNCKYVELKNIKSAVESISIGYNADYYEYRKICIDNNLGNIFPVRCYSIWGEDSPLDIEEITLEKFKGLKLESKIFYK